MNRSKNSNPANPSEPTITAQPANLQSPSATPNSTASASTSATDTPALSRRAFLSKGAIASASLTAAAIAASTKASFGADALNQPPPASTSPDAANPDSPNDDRPIRLGDDYIASLEMEPRPARWRTAEEIEAEGAAQAAGVVEESPRGGRPRNPGVGAAAGLSGSQVFALACQNENVGAFFGYAGNYGMMNAIVAQGIPSYSNRSSGNACSAADGFCRVTGDVAVASGTEGPGLGSMIFNIAVANFARSPVLVIASNRSFSGDDTEGGVSYQYQQPLTESIRKYGKRIISANRLYEYTSYAFRALKTGVPGVVHLDFPSEATGGRYTDPTALQMYAEKDRYRTDRKSAPSSKDIDDAVAMIRAAERPMIVAGMGVFYDKAWDALRAAAEKNDIAVVETAQSRGLIGDDHRLSASKSPSVLGSIDLILFVGQYSMPSIGRGDGWRVGPDAKVIRVHPEGGDIGRNWPVDLGIVSGENNFLLALADALPALKRDAWIAEVMAGRQAYEAQCDQYYQLGLQHSAATNCVHPGVLCKEVADVLYRDELPKEQTTVTIGGYGIGRYSARYTQAHRPGQLMRSDYQYEAIGPELAHAFGTGVAVQLGAGPQAAHKGAPVVAMVGDSCMGLSGFEIETFARYKIPAVIVVYNNNAQGMWTSSTPQNRHMYLFQENLRYDKFAESMGARGVYITRADKFKDEFRRAYQLAAAEKTTTLLNVQGLKEFWGNQYRPGFLQNISPSAECYNH